MLVVFKVRKTVSKMDDRKNNYPFDNNYIWLKLFYIGNKYFQ